MVPGDVAEIMPDDEPIVATEVLLLVHVPPLVALVSVVVDPVHNTEGPVMPAGLVMTLIVIWLVQPPGAMYLITEVPGEMPPTIPDGVMLATSVLLLVHAPPVPGAMSGDVLPTHTDSGPVMAPAAALTVTSLVEVHPVLRV